MTKVVTVLVTKSERGATAAEMALLILVLLSLIFFIVTLGRVYLADSVIRSSLNDSLQAARTDIFLWKSETPGAEFGTALTRVAERFEGGNLLRFATVELLDVRNDIDGNVRKFAFIPPGFCAEVIAWGETHCNATSTAPTLSRESLRKRPIEIMAFYTIDFPLYGKLRRQLSVSGYPRLLTVEPLLFEGNESGSLPPPPPNVSLPEYPPPSIREEPYECYFTRAELCDLPPCNEESFKIHRWGCRDVITGVDVNENLCNAGNGCPDEKISCGIPRTCRCIFDHADPCLESAGCGSPAYSTEYHSCEMSDLSNGVTGEIVRATPIVSLVPESNCPTGNCPDITRDCGIISTCACEFFTHVGCSWSAGCGSASYTSEIWRCKETFTARGAIWTDDARCGGCPTYRSPCPPPYGSWRVSPPNCYGVAPACDASQWSCNGSVWCSPSCCIAGSRPDPGCTLCSGPPCNTDTDTGDSGDSGDTGDSGDSGDTGDSGDAGPPPSTTPPSDSTPVDTVEECGRWRTIPPDCSSVRFVDQYDYASKDYVCVHQCQSVSGQVRCPARFSCCEGPAPSAPTIECCNECGGDSGGDSGGEGSDSDCGCDQGGADSDCDAQ